ncbi:DUF559 domain-containing protein [Kitasatospora sp. NPDC097691]|uniref:DUF559 domain-containing protein n=1 Tax=Kitasatospora sp. NPDC097691 TaxID=3157231 RepID=UPI00332442B5
MYCAAGGAVVRVCGEAFSVKVSVADDGHGFYCSNDCRHVGHRNRVELTCPCCGTRFWVPASLEGKRRTCSRDCWVKIMGADPGRSAILTKARHDLLTTRNETRPERILYALIGEVLADLAPEVAWERQHLLLSRWTVDAAVPSLRLVLQADGDYWHGLLPESREDPRVLGNMANDARQDHAITKAGWRVLRFWERDLIGDLPECAARMRAAVTEWLDLQHAPRATVSRGRQRGHRAAAGRLSTGTPSTTKGQPARLPLRRTAGQYAVDFTRSDGSVFAPHSTTQTFSALPGR